MGKLILIIAALFVLANAGDTQGTTPPASHPYVVPACNGAAHVPGYEKCHN